SSSLRLATTNPTCGLSVPEMSGVSSTCGLIKAKRKYRAKQRRRKVRNVARRAHNLAKIMTTLTRCFDPHGIRQASERCEGTIGPCASCSGVAHVEAAAARVTLDLEHIVFCRVKLHRPQTHDLKLSGSVSQASIGNSFTGPRLGYRTDGW